MTEAVWTAVRDPEEPDAWQPCLDGIGAFDLWFLTEAECIEYIKSEILGAGLASEYQTADTSRP